MFRRWLYLTAGFVLMVGMAGCSTEKVPRNPSLTLPQSFSRSGEVDAPDRWWTAFEDDRLDRLVRSSLKGNKDLHAAWDRLAQAVAVARRADADLYPQVDASVSAARDVTESAGGGGTIVGGSIVGGGGGGRSYSNEYTLNLNASYEVDVWGRVRAAVEAADQRVRASEQDLHAAAMSLSAQVANTWYRLVEERARLDLIREQTRTNEQSLELVRARFERGAVPASDLLQQRNLLEATRTRRHRVRAQIETLKHQLAVLQGRVPGQVGVPDRASLPDLPPRPETGVPAEWIRRRPDVQSAFHRIKSTDRELASALADRFPRLTIRPRFRSDAATPANLLETWSARLIASLARELFDGGRREAEIDRLRAARRERIHAYADVILTGVREVEDALTNEAQQEKRVRGLRDQLDRSRRTVDRLMDRYRSGAVEYLRVLDEIRNRQQLQRDLLTARAQLVRFRIDLYEALGGSWSLPVPEDVPESVAERTSNESSDRTTE